MPPVEVDCAHRHKGPPEQSPSRKRLVICCDGTWNNTNELGAGPPTNVSRLSGAVAHKCCSGMLQIVYYHPGAGTETSKTARVLGGAFGVGVGQDIVESYRFICDNYNPGDEIIIIGFSRGAFTARSVAGMVCALGFLNRSGLDVLGGIFHDYETWQNWGDKTFDPKEHLTAFTFENFTRVQRFKAAREKVKNGSAAPPVTVTKPDEEIKAELLDWRKRKFYELAKMKKEHPKPGQQKMKLSEMAKVYREMMAEHELSLTMPGTSWFDDRVPLPGRVKAVGVWDTVGSLGMPEIPPFYHSGRDDNELKFESLDVHPNVDHAFHAVALDEWRTSFDCTLWGLPKDNKNTKLRQVWFPGTHCNVGGGWPDQQIATIAMAWMADQLTSVGVEFNKFEMGRQFFNLSAGAKARKWGLGKIHNPDGMTSYPDWLWSYIGAPWRKITSGTTDYIVRKPGAYTLDGSKELIETTNEFVHPCVRIRYLYGGLNMDDQGPWKCLPLTGRGYKLTKVAPPPDFKPRPRRVEGFSTTYHTISDKVEPYQDHFKDVQVNGVVGTDSHPYFRYEQPSEDDDLKFIAEYKNHWSWTHPNLKTLPEEQIGVWERMYMRINEKLLTWRAQEEAAAAEKAKQDAEGAKKGFFSGIKSLFTSDTPAAPAPEETTPLAAEIKELGLPQNEQVYGYHDFVVWQRGDSTHRGSS
ncbi:hypothetical protein QBC38DRAFT_35689 [Podospora fimiseda]|uniref:T6SS Phospholipase effector Tle1-like catalytic domain-containing protein n=1 Tax=Podospora fimiseda TaxID=252190 RepID=A0AAN7GW82_9PEZI|nr:hypothetical protein QBC38DRAFT_35689 [Podospora fimiseda]